MLAWGVEIEINRSGPVRIAIATTLSGDSVTLLADRDIQVKGGNVAATHDTALIAGRNLSIEAAAESHNEEVWNAISALAKIR